METEQIHTLLIEDNKDDVELLERLIQKRIPMQIECSEDMQEALDRIKTKDFDLFLLDLSLPDSSGLQTYNMLSEKCPSTPVIIITGANDIKLATELIKKGAQDFLNKDNIDEENLESAIRFAMVRKGMERLRHQQNQATEEILEHLPSAVVVFDNNGEIFYVNQLALKTSGATISELLGQPLNKIGHFELQSNILNFDKIIKKSFVDVSPLNPLLKHYPWVRWRKNNNTCCEGSLEIASFKMENQLRWVMMFKEIQASETQSFMSPAEANDALNSLTHREKEILGKIVTGLTSREIAERLNISDRTVETHRRNMMKKLNINHLATLVKFAIDNNIVE